ncbi:helix-turn-helix transcriptional regulator [Bifidobacterium dentium]|uniref:helix-turn-helix domain-containing protein n=1 Tax=Bifidobacterium dentium TaxID=1689 RepID=UPI0018B089A7|nr:helix-turn-helix transcriptional regulator [Bifidobacterium dentium]MBF9668235.1 helix-turn-helix transcriptional regulator [Bifidobacterium dentium]
MSQRGLGKAVGLSQGNISDYETGLRRIDTMPAGKFVRILRALGGIDPSILLDQKKTRRENGGRQPYRNRGGGLPEACRRRGEPILSTAEAREKEQYDRQIEKLERRMKTLRQQLDDVKKERDEFILQHVPPKRR